MVREGPQLVTWTTVTVSVTALGITSWYKLRATFQELVLVLCSTARHDKENWTEISGQ